jgi:amino acid adenylation domain-containing protein
LPDAESLLRDEAFWLRSLQSLSPFELPSDHARPPVQTSNSAIASLPLDRSLVDALRDLSRRHGCTLYMTTLAALLALLHRYTGESDIAIASQSSDDDDDGRFTNAFVVRSDLSGDPAFAELLARVRDTVVEGLKHLGTPLDRVIEMLAPARDPSRPALCSIRFTFQVPPRATGARYDLDFSMIERPDGWGASCEYNTDLFAPATAARLLGHFANLLRAAVAEPAQPIGTMPMLDAEERRALVADGNRTDASYPEHLTVAQLFERQVQRTPDATAVTCGELELSYRELERAANGLAHRLRDCGVGRGSRVSIFLDRSPDMVVALLAVLKAGGAYVPLDPGHPPARLAQIVGDAQPALVLTEPAARARLPDSVDAAALMVLDGAPARDAPPQPAASPEDLAYVIYTSGSTGRPKGVQITHRALTNLLWSMRGTPGLAPDDTLVAVTTISFDIAALELFLPLIVGAKLVLASETEAGDGGALAALLLRHRATVLQATPVTWQILLAGGWRPHAALKMLCGGEALPRALADRLLVNGGELWNMYGPTETTIWSSALRVGPGAGAVPIGPPIANTQFHVLDANGQLVPAGVPGELCIGGDGVAAGYLNLPEKTRERFVPDPLRGRAGARLYRTGDRVRRRPRGELEFLGRMDHQVKVRGFRIELGEIETVIRAHAQVADCVAVAVPDASGETAIRAYVVARRAETAAAAMIESLRSSLRQALPGYMCPAAIVVLAALPRTPNGKVDRNALPAPAPEPALETSLEDGVAPSAVEQRLAQLWCAVLQVSEVGVNANFFEVGGHSLLAVRLLARIEAVFGTRLSLAALFANPTVAGLARLLTHGDPRAFDFRQVVALQPDGARPPLIALNNTGIYYALSKRLGADRPFTSLQLFDPSVPRASLPQTLEDIAAEYVQLIRRVQRTGPYALLGWCVAGTLAFEVARQLRASGQAVSRLILFDTLAPGHLRRLPWFKAVLADYAYRWNLIAADWRRARQGPRALAVFLGNRASVRKLRQWFARRAELPARAPAPGVALTPGEFDQWLLGYLEETAASYQPQPYAGAVTLFRSSQEPAGRFIDPQMGWGAFAEGGIEVAVIEGDHFSIFQEPAVWQVAQRIDSALRAAG